MDNHKILFKASITNLDPQQHKANHRVLQQQNRARQRDLQFQQTRNDAITSQRTVQQLSAKKQKRVDAARLKENSEMDNVEVEEDTNAVTDLIPRLSYRERYVIWKKEREKQKQLLKLEKQKKPFVLYGKYTGDQKQLPTRFKSTVIGANTKTDDHVSIYLAAPLPSK